MLSGLTNKGRILLVNVEAQDSNPWELQRPTAAEIFDQLAKVSANI